MGIVESVKEKKKGLLVVPEFPKDTFWSYKHILPFIKAKAAYPPLGLLTVAAYFPDYDFELVDFNVKHLSNDELREKIDSSDFVFASAMGVQSQSLAYILENASKGSKTPWVVGGSLASTFREHIFYGEGKPDSILRVGLDMLVFGETNKRSIDQLVNWLDTNPTHSDAKLSEIIPDQVKKGSGYLMDETLFLPINVPTPRWDLIKFDDYRTAMIQTTAGCPSRCDFCEIINFNGGFIRAKNDKSIRNELQGIYDAGYRGAVFTVDDNFIGDIALTKKILKTFIDFQREHNYPFNFFTQASVNLGIDENEELLAFMKYAGFSAVFLGIETPNKEILKKMRKMNNLKVDLEDVVKKIHKQGIEVYAGFIYGSDGDSHSTAKQLVKFVKKTNIFSAMVARLTPIPTTTLYEKLKKQGRLVPDLVNENNSSRLHFKPEMGEENMQKGFSYILRKLYTPHHAYGRILKSLKEINPHIFQGTLYQPVYKHAAAQSILRQGIARMDINYFYLIGRILLEDSVGYVKTKRETNKIMGLAKIYEKRQGDLTPKEASLLDRMIDYAKEAKIRYDSDITLEEIENSFIKLKASIADKTVKMDDLKKVYEDAQVYLNARLKLFKLPGINLISAFERVIKGLHYQKVMETNVKGTYNCVD